MPRWDGCTRRCWTGTSTILRPGEQRSLQFIPLEENFSADAA